MCCEIKNSFTSNTWQLYYWQRIKNATRRVSHRQCSSLRSPLAARAWAWRSLDITHTRPSFQLIKKQQSFLDNFGRTGGAQTVRPHPCQFNAFKPCSTLIPSKSKAKHLKLRTFIKKQQHAKTKMIDALSSSSFRTPIKRQSTTSQILSNFLFERAKSKAKLCDAALSSPYLRLAVNYFFHK